VNTGRKNSFSLRLHDWLHRRRLIRGEQWGRPSLAKRIFRIRLQSAAILAVPSLLLWVWYLTAAWAAHVAHQAELGVTEPLTLSLIQLHLHDKLTRDVQRLMAPEPQRKSVLPTYGLIVSNESLDQLSKRLPPEDGQPFYVDAQLVKGSRVHSVQVRYRGGKFWHYNHPQKSWKVRVKDGNVVDGFNTFAFINTPESVPFEEEIVLDVAREMGLLSPEYFPFRLLVNKAYTGVYFFESQPDEGMLKHASRPLGTIYSGSDSPVDPATGVSTLFKSADNFTKVNQGIHQSLGERIELEGLVFAINRASPEEFGRYAERHLDIERFAQWDALDVVFGCNQHDFSENHKLYFDPFRDKFEPIAWNYRGCKHDRELNRTENPLILRLKQQSDYLSRRNRIVYQLLQGRASPAALRERTAQLLEKLREDQSRDPYWDAFQLLPAVSPYYSLLLRPVSRAAQKVAVETRLFELEDRKAYLSELLEGSECTLALATSQVPSIGNRAGAIEMLSVLDVSVAGNGGYFIEQVEPTWGADCKPGSWQLFADTNLDGKLQFDIDREVVRNGYVLAPGQQTGELHPGTVMQRRAPQVHRGNVRTTSESRLYRFFMKSTGCAPVSMKLRLRNVVTLASFERFADARVGVATSAIPASHCYDKYAEEIGQSSPHSWCYVQGKVNGSSIGPGIVDINESRTYSEDEPVEILPGTTLRLAKDASLIFYGRVIARGTEGLPIQFEAKDGFWGGVALQGSGTKGSVLDHVTLRGGTQPHSSTVLWPGLVNVNDTSDISLGHCSIVTDRQSRLAVHIGESKNIAVFDMTVQGGARSIQIQYSDAHLTNSTFVGATADAVHITSSRVEIRSSKMVSYGSDGISANGQSVVSLDNAALLRGGRGLYADEASEVQCSRVLLFENRDCSRLDAVNEAHGHKTRIVGRELLEVGCTEARKASTESNVVQGNKPRNLTPNDLASLRADVLRIATWDQLSGIIENLAGGRRR